MMNPISSHFKPLPPVLISTIVIGTALNCLSISSVGDLAQDVHPSKFGSFNFTELEQTMYEVELLRVPLPESALVKKEENNQGDKTGARPDHVILVSKHGQRYACELPWQPPSSEDHADNEETEPEMNITALLLPLHNRPCLIKTVGWWTYEYCHGHFVRQYHMEAGKIMGKTIYLGFYDNETVWNQRQIDRVQNMIESMKDNIGPGAFPVAYHRVSFTNGTVCDLTGKPRATKVKIHCGLTGEDRLYEVIESETCVYTIVIQTSLLCGHPFFDAGIRGRTKSLGCSPLLSQADYAKYQQEEERMKKEEELRMKEKESESVARDETEWNEDPTITKTPSLLELLTSKSRDHTASHEQRATSKPDPSLHTASPTEQAEDVREQDDVPLEEVQKTIELLYKQLVASLDEHKDTDSTAAKLRDSVVSKYEDFERRMAIQKEVEKHLTEDEKNFRESEEETPPTKQRERSGVKPYEVQGVGQDLSSEQNEGTDQSHSPKNNLHDILKASLEGELIEKEAEDEEETLTMERLEDALSEEIQERFRESGLAEVKVFTLSSNVMDLLEGDEEETSDDKSNKKASSVKIVHVKLDESDQRLLSEHSQGDGLTENKLSRFLSSLFTTPAEAGVSSEQRKVRELESSYDQVWGEQSNSDKDRKT